MRKILLIALTLGLLLLINLVSTPRKPAQAATVLSNVGNMPIVDPEPIVGYPLIICG